MFTGVPLLRALDDALHFIEHGFDTHADGWRIAEAATTVRVLDVGQHGDEHRLAAFQPENGPPESPKHGWTVRL